MEVNDLLWQPIKGAAKKKKMKKKIILIIFRGVQLNFNTNFVSNHNFCDSLKVKNDDRQTWRDGLTNLTYMSTMYMLYSLFIYSY